MTHEETIKTLDELIVYLNRIIAENEPPSNFVNNVIHKLKELDISANVIKTIAGIEIEQPNSFFQYSLDLQHFESERKKKNRASVQSIIDILKVEQELHKRILEEEDKRRVIAEQKKNFELQEIAIAEQKESNKLAIWAIIIAVLSLLISIFK